MSDVVVVNLTPHDINIFVEGQIITFEPSGMIARASSSIEEIGRIGSIPVFKTVLGEITGLPEPKENTIYLVSRAVAERVPDRAGIDVFIPTESIRDGKGNIIGCKGFGIV